MRLLFFLPCIMGAITAAAGLSVHIATSLNGHPVYLAHLWAFLGIAVLTSVFVVMGESLLEDVVKVGIFIVLSLLAFAAHTPPLIPCTAIAGALLAIATNQLLKRFHKPS